MGADVTETGGETTQWCAGWGAGSGDGLALHSACTACVDAQRVWAHVHDPPPRHTAAGCENAFARMCVHAWGRGGRWVVVVGGRSLAPGERRTVYPAGPAGKGAPGSSASCTMVMSVMGATSSDSQDGARRTQMKANGADWK